MKLVDFRTELGLTQEAFAKLVGLSSKSRISDLENEEGQGTCSARVALEIERLSEGRVDAATLSPDVAMVRARDNEAA